MAEEEVVDDAAIDGEVTVGDLTASAYDADAGTLSVTISLDADTATALYDPDGTLNGFDRFSQQDEPTDRYFVGLAKESDDGSVVATVVQDGGQFNRFFGGAVATQNNYSAPTTGLTSYAGGYVGLLNFGPSAGASGGDASLDAGTPTEVTGTVFLNADFNDNSINGSIYERAADLDQDGISDELATIILTSDDFTSDGGFTGTVELGDLTGVGTYGGVFGGTDASAVAGVVNLTGADFLDGTTLSGGGEFEGDQAHNEFGIFVADQCTAASGAICVGSEAIDE